MRSRDTLPSILGILCLGNRFIQPEAFVGGLERRKQATWLRFSVCKACKAGLWVRKCLNIKWTEVRDVPR